MQQKNAAQNKFYNKNQVYMRSKRQTTVFVLEK